MNAVIALAVGFGAPITTQQAGLINAAVASILALILRAHVTPVGK